MVLGGAAAFGFPAARRKSFCLPPPSGRQSKHGNFVCYLQEEEGKGPWRVCVSVIISLRKEDWGWGGYWHVPVAEQTLTHLETWCPAVVCRKKKGCLPPPRR